MNKKTANHNGGGDELRVSSVFSIFFLVLFQTEVECQTHMLVSDLSILAVMYWF